MQSHLGSDVLVSFGIGEPCEGSDKGPATTVASDWHDTDRAVEYIRALRSVERLSLFGWSLGGRRAGGYTARYPDKVHKLALLAPACNRASPDDPPSRPGSGAAMTAKSQESFIANWDRQFGCENQYDPALAAGTWSEMLRSDPVGATWGPGIRRARRTAV